MIDIDIHDIDIDIDIHSIDSLENLNIPTYWQLNIIYSILQTEKNT